MFQVVQVNFCSITPHTCISIFTEKEGWRRPDAVHRRADEKVASQRHSGIFNFHCPIIFCYTRITYFRGLQVVWRFRTRVDLQVCEKSNTVGSRYPEFRITRSLIQWFDNRTISIRNFRGSCDRNFTVIPDDIRITRPSYKIHLNFSNYRSVLFTV